MQKLLFIDRDGTIIDEPKTDFQIDSLEKLEFLPKALSNLRKIAEETDYQLIMVTNQDGLGTESFPEDTFWPAHNKMLKTMENENIHFSAIHIDRSFPHENLPTRKPGTALLSEYFDAERYDLKNSYILGDRATDVQLAVNLGAQAIFIITNDGWWQDTPGYKQHMSFSRLRAIENRRSVARSANTGISCFINQRGDVVKRSKWWEPIVLKGTINLNNDITTYTKYGDVIGRSFAFVSVLILLLTFTRAFKRIFTR